MERKLWFDNKNVIFTTVMMPLANPKLLVWHHLQILSLKFCEQSMSDSQNAGAIFDLQIKENLSAERVIARETWKTFFFSFSWSNSSTETGFLRSRRQWMRPPSGAFKSNHSSVTPLFQNFFRLILAFPRGSSEYSCNFSSSGFLIISGIRLLNFGNFSDLPKKLSWVTSRKKGWGNWSAQPA